MHLKKRRNGNAYEFENGKTGTDAKEPEIVCSVRRNPVGGFVENQFLI